MPPQPQQRPAILTAGGIVVAAMLVLTLADYRATATMGPVLAVGTAVTVAAGLTLLPGAAGDRSARAPSGRPSRARGGRVVGARSAAVVRDAAGGHDPRSSARCSWSARSARSTTGHRSSFTDSFRDAPESVTGQELIARRATSPACSVRPRRSSPRAASGHRRRRALAHARRRCGRRHRALERPQADAGRDHPARRTRSRRPRRTAFPRCATRCEACRRAASRAARRPRGRGATTRAWRCARDAALIVPLTLVLVLADRRRCSCAPFVAPLYLVGTVVLSYAFALGASSLHLHARARPARQRPGAAARSRSSSWSRSGVDYNVFLISRIREERERPRRAATP